MNTSKTISERDYEDIIQLQLCLNSYGCEVFLREQRKGNKISISSIKLLMIKNLILDYYVNSGVENDLITEMEFFFSNLQNNYENLDYFQLVEAFYNEFSTKENLPGIPWNLFSGEYSDQGKKYPYKNYRFLGFLIQKKILEISDKTGKNFPEYSLQLMNTIDEKSKRNTRYLENRIHFSPEMAYQNFYNHFIFVFGPPEEKRKYEPNTFLFLMDMVVQNLPLWLIKYHLGLSTDRLNFFHIFRTRNPGDRTEIVNGTVIFLDVQKKYKRKRTYGKRNEVFDVETIIWDKNNETLFYIRSQGDTSKKNSLTSRLKNTGTGDTISLSGKHFRTIELFLGDEKIKGEFIKSVRIKKT